MPRPNRCSDCGDLSAWLYAVDGTSAACCGACIAEVIQLSNVTASLRRIHAAGHGWDLPPTDCPVCQSERTDLVARLSA